MEDKKSTRKMIQYPDMKRPERTVKQKLHAESLKMVILPDEVTDLINSNQVAFEILAPFFDKRVQSRKETNKRYLIRIRAEKREEDSRLFFESLNEEQTKKFLEMRSEYNLLFDEGKLREAEIKRRSFSSWLSRDKNWLSKYEYGRKHYEKNRESILEKSRNKTKAIRDSPTVKCNLCSMILENNSVQKRKHSQYHKKLVADGQVRWGLPT